jgi:hypothetical protein
MKLSKILFSGLFSIMFLFACPISAQYWNDINIDYKWSYDQDWSETAKSWGDTTSLEYLTFDAADKANCIYMRDRNDKTGKLEKSGKMDLAWESANIKSMLFFMIDTATGTYTTTPMLSMFPTYQNNKIIRVETIVSNLDNLIGNLNLELLDGTDPAVLGILGGILSKIQIKTISGIEYQNAKMIKDSTMTFAIFPPDITPEMKLMLKTLGLPLTDTMKTSKTEYQYSQNYEIRKTFEWDTASKAWQASSKDSLAIVNGKYILSYTSIITPGTQVEMLFSRDSMIYNESGKLSSTISQTLSENVWVNSSKSVYFYTPYLGAGVHFNHNARRIPALSAVAAKSGGQTIINLTTDKASTLEISIFNMDGKIVSKNTANCTQGINSIPVKNLPQGNFICKISDGKSMVIVPFNTMKK